MHPIFSVKKVVIKPDTLPFGLLTNVFLIVGCICCLPYESAFFVAFGSGLENFTFFLKPLSTFESFHSSVTVRPVRSVEPVEPVRPVGPVEPVEPVEPVVVQKGSSLQGSRHVLLVT